VAYLYILRHSTTYQSVRQHFEKTRPTVSRFGERRQPQPNGRPGYLRVDTVHQGDFDRVKGGYHINAVDEVTPFEIVCSVEKISERYLIPVLEDLLDQFPFVILAFHADNGSEYINKHVVKLLNTLLVELTKSRARHCNDNAFVESKNGAIIRKQLGYVHIPQQWAPQLNAFHRDHLQSLHQLSPALLFPGGEHGRQGESTKTLPLRGHDDPL
jgi:transposase InsO family protein